MKVAAVLMVYLIQQLLRAYSFKTHSSGNPLRSITQLQYLDMSRLTTLEVEDYVRKGVATTGVVPIVIAIGATEQHGPTGLIGTDSQTSLAVAQRVCEECDVMLGPQLQVGMSLHHCGFAGSASLRPSTLVNMICDIVQSLYESSNFTHFYFINGHGGNVLPMKLAFAILRAKMKTSWTLTKIVDSSDASDNKRLQWAIDESKRWDPSFLLKTNAPQNSEVKEDNMLSDEVNHVIRSDVNSGLSVQHDSNGPESTSPNDTISEGNLPEVISQIPDIITTHSRPQFVIEMVSWYANNESQALARSLYGDQLGQHATPDEVAITMYLFPELQKDAFLDPEVLNCTLPGRTARRNEGGSAAEVDEIISGLLKEIVDEEECSKIRFLGKMALNYMDATDFRKRFADGRMWSNPGLATNEHGKLLLETSTKAVVNNFREFVAKVE